MADNSENYAARLDIDYPEKLSRLTTFFRFILIIPIAIILSLLTATGNETLVSVTGEVTTRTVGGIASALFFATALMIIIRRKYPRWWFDFAREMERFGARVAAYLVFLTDQYPSTTDEQAVHLEIDYPDAENDLNQWMPIVKWFLAIPHYVVIAILAAIAVIVIVISWFAILITGRFPKPFFAYVVGVARWALRVQAYAILLVTDQYPPFSMK